MELVVIGGAGLVWTLRKIALCICICLLVDQVMSHYERQMQYGSSCGLSWVGLDSKKISPYVG